VNTKGKEFVSNTDLRGKKTLVNVQNIYLEKKKKEERGGENPERVFPNQSVHIRDRGKKGRRPIPNSVSIQRGGKKKSHIRKKKGEKEEKEMDIRDRVTKRRFYSTSTLLREKKKREPPLLLERRGGKMGKGYPIPLMVCNGGEEEIITLPFSNPARVKGKL